MGTAFSSHFNSHKSAKRPAAAGITEADKAILSLKTQRNKLNDQSKLLDKRIDRYQQVAKELLAEGKKDRALLALKKKKLSTVQQQSLHNYQMRVEEMLSGMEMSKQQAKLFDVLKEGNEQLKALQAQVSIDDVQKLMDDTAEAQAYQDELNNALGQSLTEIDEEAIAAEFEMLEAESLLAEKTEMPSVPLTQPAQATAQAAAAAEESTTTAELPEVPKEKPMLAA